jgi:dihydroorotase-like cyclic amidohydrolase
VHDGGGRLAFPGVVDAHMHSGIYSPLAEDAVSESRAAAMGGVTSSLNYFRTGQYYLNKGGPYKKFFPEVLKISKNRFHVDYGYHLAPMNAAHRRDPDADREARRHQLQDLHVLRLARPARREQFAARVPDDRRGRTLRLRRTSSS